MRGEDKITTGHLGRRAVVYVRQSTLAQVREHTESTQRQYALVNTAIRFGWDPAMVDVIDADLGISGASTEGRDGYRELVGRVCVGEVGAIFGLEISRLARSSADLGRLLELVRLTDTLVIDTDGAYNLADFNDRLLLGLKGTMSEAELHYITSRMQGAKRAAAERGDLRCPLPVGYVYDDDNMVVIDPDEEVRQAIADLFAAYDKAGSAYGVVEVFGDRPFPKRAYGGVWAGDIKWGRLTYSRVCGVLANPTYAGTYVYGRYKTRKDVQPDGTITTRTQQLGRDQWEIVIQDHHEGYIDWRQYLQIEANRHANRTNAGARPPREGPVLCQGIVLCAGCGNQIGVRYNNGYGVYECTKSRADNIATDLCRSVRADVVDDAVVSQLFEAIEPAQIKVALDAADEVTDRRRRSTRAAELAVERARYDAERAERALLQCDPDNRLVARSLESRWENKLGELADAETALAETRNAQAPLPERGDLETLVGNIPALWAAESTSDKDRKRILRTLIEDVTLTLGTETIDVGIHWRSGATQTLNVARPQKLVEYRKNPPGAIEMARRTGATLTNNELADRLNAAGYRTGTALRLSSCRISGL